MLPCFRRRFPCSGFAWFTRPSKQSSDVACPATAVLTERLCPPGPRQWLFSELLPGLVPCGTRLPCTRRVKARGEGAGQPSEHTRIRLLGDEREGPGEGVGGGRCAHGPCAHPQLRQGEQARPRQWWQGGRRPLSHGTPCALAEGRSWYAVLTCGACLPSSRCPCGTRRGVLTG